MKPTPEYELQSAVCEKSPVKVSSSVGKPHDLGQTKSYATKETSRVIQKVSHRTKLWSLLGSKEMNPWKCKNSVSVQV